MVNGVVCLIFLTHLPAGTGWVKEALSNSSALAATLECHQEQMISLSKSGIYLVILIHC